MKSRVAIDVHSANGEVRLYLRGYPLGARQMDCGVGLTPEEAIRTARSLAARAREAKACQDVRTRRDRRPRAALRAYTSSYPGGFAAILLGDDFRWYHRSVGGTVSHVGRQAAAAILRSWRQGDERR